MKPPILTKLLIYLRLLDSFFDSMSSSLKIEYLNDQSRILFKSYPNETKNPQHLQFQKVTILLIHN